MMELPLGVLGGMLPQCMLLRGRDEVVPSVSGTGENRDEGWGDASWCAAGAMEAPRTPSTASTLASGLLLCVPFPQWPMLGELSPGGQGGTKAWLGTANLFLLVYVRCCVICQLPTAGKVPVLAASMSCILQQDWFAVFIWTTLSPLYAFLGLDVCPVAGITESDWQKLIFTICMGL